MKIYIFFISLLVAFSNPASSEESPSSTIEAAETLANLFSSLLKPFEEIGQNAEKAYFIDQLLELNRKLFDVEQEKRYVILALNRNEISRNELSKTSDSLSRKIRKLREGLLAIAPKLRVTYREKADKSIDQLSDAIGTRKGFVFNLSDVKKESAKSAIEDANRAITALSEAQVALANAIDYLQKD